MTRPENSLKRFEKRLLELKGELLEAAQTGEDAERVVELDQARVGRLSRVDAMQARAMSVETGRRRQILIMEIDAALARIRSGEYGSCLDCGNAISPGRLDADPVARLCIHCAELRE